MSTFKRFYDSECETQQQLEHNVTLPQSIGAAAASIAGPSLIKQAGGKKEEFASLAASIAGNGQFISELSDKIGEPGEHETEAEFVNRAQGEMRSLLMKKLGVDG